MPLAAQAFISSCTVAVLGNDSHSVLTVSKASCGPPTVMVSDAAFAPTSPPDTGASRYWQPSSLIFLAKPLVAIGEIELMSTTILPLDRPAATPFSPNKAASTCGVSGTMVMMMSACLATSAPDLHAVAPPLVSTAGGVLMSYTYSVWPPFCRFSAIGAPMIPSPINPTFAMIFYLLI